MATLVSPGASVTINDQTVAAGVGAGTIPMIFIATQANKLLPDGSGGIAPGTQAANAGLVYNITSQRQLLQTFGNPFFNSVSGTVQQGDEVNEYGLHAAYSYLGIANQAYVVRADLDMAQLLETETQPTGAPANGTYWFNYATTSFGVFRSNGNATPGLAWNQVKVSTPSLSQVGASAPFAPLNTYGASGDIAVSVWNTNNALYEKIGTTWYEIGTSQWKAARPTVLTATNTFASATLNTISATASGSAVLHFTTVPNTIVAGMIATDTTTGSIIPAGTTVLSTTSTTVTLSANVTNAGVASGDAILFAAPVGTGNAGTLQIDGVNIAVAATDTLYSIVANTGSNVPNVTASIVANKLTLTDSSGADIVIGSGSTAATLTALGFTAGTNFGYHLTYAPHTSVPSGIHAGRIWVKTTNPNYGANYVVSLYNSSLNQFNTVSAPLNADDVTAEINGGFGLGLLYVQYNTTGTASSPIATQVIKRLGSTSPVTVSTTAYVAPSSNDTISIRTRGSTGTGANTDITIPVSVTVSETVTNVAAAINTAVAANGFVPHIVASVVSGQLVVTSTNGTAFQMIDGTHSTLSNMTMPLGMQSNWSVLSYEASITQPSSVATEGTLWFDPALTVDIMVNNGNQWVGYRNYYPATDPAGVQISSSMPTTQSNGNALANNDLWLDSSNVVGYPALYRYLGGVWTLIDNTDHTTPMGVVFGDIRQDSGPIDPGTGWLESRTTPLTGTALAQSTLVQDLIHSNWSDPVDLQILNPETFPTGILLFNTEFGTNNVKVRRNSYFTGVSTYSVGNFLTSTFETAHPGSQAAAAAYLAANPGRWVTDSGNDANGVVYSGRAAQRACVIKALAAQITGNQAILAEAIYYNLIACPGYVEVFSDLVTLNVNRNETAFIITDVPSTLSSDATSVQNWATNAANVTGDGVDGRITEYDYAAMYYPWGLGTNVDGSQVVVPSSTVALNTYGYNDRVAYPWYPPAGVRRGTVQNASSVGYVDIDTEEYVPVTLNQGQRDVLFTNNINPIAFMPGQGLLVYGDKTTSGDATSLLTRVNVARLIVYLRWIVPQIVQQFLFELNTASVQASAQDVVSKFLTGLLGQNAIQDFVVVCDSSNNTPETEALNQLWIDVAVVPTKSIDFVYVPITILTSLN